MMSAGYAGELPEAARDYVDGILQSTNRLSTLIDNVLDLTQGEAGTLPIDHAPVDLAALARERAEHIRATATDRGIDLAVSLDPSFGEIQGDAKRLGQAIDHLVENAVCHCARGARVLIHGDGTADTARIVISDDGPGIPQRQQATIFDTAARTRQARAGAKVGIGLPLARQLAEAHGGTLQLVSEPGQGTMVVIELPRG